jgi:hypothetical protein
MSNIFSFIDSTGIDFLFMAVIHPPVIEIRALDQWYSTFFVRVPPDIISLQLYTPKVVGV